jgi:hypothetical protein
MKTKIFAICEELQKSGVKPTLEKVREALGGGSFSTINPILKEWKEQQATSEPPVLELPAEALQAVSQAAALIWKIASDKATELTNSIKTEFETLLKEAVAEKEEALKEIARLEQTTAKLTADLEKSLKEHQSLVLQVQKQQLALDACEKQNSELKADQKAYQEELKEAISEAAMLKGQLAVYEKMQKGK